MSEERLRVLVLDDEASLREPLKKYLEDRFHYWVDVAADGEEALRLVSEASGRYDVALIDQVLMPGPDGIQVMQEIRGRYPDVECIIFTGWGLKHKQRALEAGAFRYLEKPFDHDELAMLIRTAAQQVRLRAISRDVLSELDLEQVLDRIAAAARSLALAGEAAIVLLDQASNKLRLYAKSYPAEQQWRRHLKDQDLSREIVRSGKIVSISDIRQDTRVDPKFVESGLCSFVGVPIPGENGNLGVLYVYSQNPGHFDAWGTTALLQTLAGQAGLAIANAQAFQQIRSYAGYMEALVRAERGLTKATQLEDQLVLAWDFVREQLQISTFFVALYDRQTKTLCFPLAYEEGGQISIPDRYLGSGRAEWGVSGYIVKTGQELLWLTSESGRQQCASLDIRPIEVGGPPSTQSCFYFPLKSGDETIGVISIQSYAPHAFSAILLDAFRALGSQLAVALDNSRLFSELVEAKEWREALIESAFDAVVAIDASRKITVFNRSAEKMFGWKAEEMIGETVARLHIDMEKARSIFEAVSREPITGWNVDLKHQDDTSIPALLSATQIQDSNGHPIGQAGFIRDLRRVNLLEERLRALIRVSQAISGILELDEVLDRVIQAAVNAFPAAQHGAIHLYDERSDLLRLQASTFDYSPSAVEAMSLKPGEGIAGWVFQHRQPAVIDNPGQDPRYKQFDHPETPAHKSIICVPLQVRGRVIGALSLDNLDLTGAFQAEDLELLSTFADQAAIAYDNARRVRELEHMRKAAEAIAGALEPLQVLQQIVESAKEVLQADSSAIWSYDNVRNQFISEELVASGIPRDELEKFRKREPKRGGTADTVMERGWVGVTDVSDPHYDFMGPSTLNLLAGIGAKSFQGIALKAGDERLGVLYVNYNHPQSFTDADKSTLATFAHHAGLAHKKARLLRQVGRARDTAKVVAEVSALGDLKQTLASIVKGTQGALGCDAVILYTYDQERAEFGFPPTMVGVDDEEEVLKLGRVMEQSLVWRIMAQGKIYEAEDAPSDPLMQGPFVSREGIQSSAGVPLQVRDHKVGVMFVNYRSRHRFTVDELTNIELFANQAAVAIRNAQLYQREQHHRQAIMAIQETSAAVSAVLQLDTLLPMITNKAAQIFDVPASSLMLWDDGQEYLVIRAAFGLGDEYRREQRIPRSTISHLLQGAKAGPHVFNIHDKPLGDPRLIQLEELYTVLVAPLMVGGELIGVLNVYSRGRPRWFEERERELAGIFANHAAIAIQNARSYEELKQTKGLVGARTAVAWMGMVSAAWRHGIGNYATTIEDLVEYLRSDLEKGAPIGKIKQRLADIEAMLTKIRETPITAPLSTEEGVESVPIKDLIRERVKQLWDREPYESVQYHLNLALEEWVTVRASPEWLKRAIDVLIDNAVDAMAMSAVKKLDVAARVVNGRVEISLSDTGKGIPEEVQARLFQEPIKKPKGAKGAGVGLLQAQTIVQTYGGEINVRSTGPTGTTMIVWLPLEAETLMRG